MHTPARLTRSSRTALAAKVLPLLIALIGVSAEAQTPSITYTSDNQSNVLTATDALNHTTTFNSYDGLNRLTKLTDPLNGVTQYGYNSQNAITSVTDPRTLVTSYTRDGLGNLTNLQSPDTGGTANTFDAAGNVLSRTDARGAVSNYTYDALNRVLTISYPGSSSLNVAFTYDQGTNGKGHLTGVTDSTGSSSYSYDPHGRLLQEQRIFQGQTATTSYAYDSSGRLSTLTYPSGRTVTYTYDTAGRISRIDTSDAGNNQNVINTVTWFPFGGVEGWVFWNGALYARTYDQYGRTTSYSFGSDTRTLGYDAGNRITALNSTANPSLNQSYGYDNDDRVTGAVLPSTTYGFAYDAVGNRTSKTTGANTDQFTYSPTANQIATLTPAGAGSITYSYDQAGNTESDGNNQYSYDARGRLQSIVSAAGTTMYQYNYLGQRLSKTSPSGTVTLYHYDVQGHLIAEWTTAGGAATAHEYVYLGDTPVAMFVAGSTPTPYAIYTDHLNTPRLIQNAANQAAWSWDNLEPFGTNADNENPGGLGTFVFNLRYPGQYFDTESTTHYNYYRDYNPGVGRYVESDPIGLRGGLNTYAYAGGSPLWRIDLWGLWSPGGHDAFYFNTFVGVLSSAEIETIQAESRRLDIATGVGIAGANIHSMRKPFQSVANAIAARNKFICDNLQEARDAPDRDQALKHFADAAHTITDYYSPKHTDSSGNPRIWVPGLVWGHSPNEYIGGETAKDITPEIYDQVQAALVDAYNLAFGAGSMPVCGCK